MLHRAFDIGVRFVDTSDAYCKHEGEKHHNERLIRKAIESYPDQAVAAQVVVATKGICVRPEGRWERCATPAQIARAIAGSHEALCGNAKPIDLWQIHWCQVRSRLLATLNASGDVAPHCTAHSTALHCTAGERRQASRG